jgi:hypothetical protein
MIMTVEEVIEILSQHDKDLEVRIIWEMNHEESMGEDAIEGIYQDNSQYYVKRNVLYLANPMAYDDWLRTERRRLQNDES